MYGGWCFRGSKGWKWAESFKCMYRKAGSQGLPACLQAMEQMTRVTLNRNQLPPPLGCLVHLSIKIMVICPCSNFLLPLWSPAERTVLSGSIPHTWSSPHAIHHCVLEYCLFHASKLSLLALSSTATPQFSCHSLAPSSG